MKKFIVLGLVLYYVSSSLGLFLGRDPFGLIMLFWLSGFALLAICVFYTAYITPERLKAFYFITLGIILLNFLVQITGGIHSWLWPAYFLFAILVAAFSPPSRTYAVTTLILGVETANLLAPKHVPDFQWEAYAGYAFTLVIVSAATTHIMHRRLQENKLVKDAHERLIASATAVDTPRDETKLAALTNERRQAANLNTVMQREITFNGLIDMIYEFVPAHTYALYLKERVNEDQVFVLRAIRSASGKQYLSVVGDTLPPGSILGAYLHCTQPQDLDPVSQKLGYYASPLPVPVRTALAIPIVQDADPTGLLVVDSLEEGAFSFETKDTLSRFAPFFIQIIDKIRVSRELNQRATIFEALHEISSVLNSSLELSEVLERLAAKIRVLVSYDLCIFAHYDDKYGEMVLVHQSGAVSLAQENHSFAAMIKTAITPENSSKGPAMERRFPIEKSAVLGQMLRLWDEGQGRASPYHFPDTGDRRQEIRLFDDSIKLTQSLRSLSCWPLVAGKKFIGAFFIGSVKANAFSNDDRAFLDTLMNQVAVVMDNAILHRQVRNMAHTDGLTGLLNHRTFMEKMDEEFNRLDRAEQQHFSLLLFDIDHFKKVNDEHGHPVGDIALKAVANVIRQTARSIDFVARYGGEEFAIGMVGADTAGAQMMAERIRKTVESTVITAGKITLKKTVSIGVASYYPGCGKKEVLIAQTDQALYHAKHTGRNKVCLFSDIPGADAAVSSGG